MKLLPLIWTGLWRTPTRTVLTVLSILVAFTLFGFLESVNVMFGGAIAKAHLDRLTVSSPFGPIPLAYRDQLERLPGVRRVTVRAGVGGYFQEPKNRVFVSMIDENWFATYDEYDIPPSARAALAEKRDAVLVSVKMAQRFGWKVGDTIPLQSIGPNANTAPAWQFEVSAIVPDTERMPEGFALGNFSYFEELRPANRGTVGSLMVLITDPGRSEEMSERIDAMFANAGMATRTQSEYAMAQMQYDSFVNVELITTSIIAAVFFMLLFMTSNSMTQSVRERIPEFAVLKTIGFSDFQAFGLVLGELLVLCLLGGAAGLATASLLMTTAQAALNIGPPAQMNLSVVVAGGMIAVAVAVVSGAQPAWRMKRLEVIDALAGR